MAKEQSPIAWTLLPLKKYAKFSGRSGRAEFWWFTLACVVSGFGFDAIDYVLGSEIGILGLLFTVATIIPTLSVTVRRLHDIGMSGWWLLAVVAPAAVVGFQSSTAALDQQFNGVAPAGSFPIAISVFVMSCLILTICLALPGKKGPNAHGADPYGDQGGQAFA